MVPDNSAGIPRVPAYSGAAARLPSGLRLRDSHPLRSGVPPGPAVPDFLFIVRPYYPAGSGNPTVWALPLSIASTRGIVVTFFSCGYLDVSVPRVRSAQSSAVTGSLPPGCPIRISAAVAGICPLPRLFAAYHVLRRLREPRHPPCALVYSVYLRYALRSYRRRVPFYLFRLCPIPHPA